MNSNCSWVQGCSLEENDDFSQICPFFFHQRRRRRFSFGIPFSEKKYLSLQYFSQKFFSQMPSTCIQFFSKPYSLNSYYSIFFSNVIHQKNENCFIRNRNFGIPICRKLNIFFEYFLNSTILLQSLVTPCKVTHDHV